jgi:hypothetical protein
MTSCDQMMSHVFSLEGETIHDRLPFSVAIGSSTVPVENSAANKATHYSKGSRCSNHECLLQSTTTVQPGTWDVYLVYR